MKLGKLAAVLLLAVVALLAPTTAAQAASSSCAPTEQDRWLGTYSGPHYDQHGNNKYGDLEISVYVKDGELRIMRQNLSMQAELRDGLLKTIWNSLMFTLTATSATCGSNGAVNEFSGYWMWDPSFGGCAWGCLVYGEFEATRI